MSEERDFEGLGPELMRAAPLLPAGGLGEKEIEDSVSAASEAEGGPDVGGSGAGFAENNPAVKAVIRQAIVSGRTEAALNTMATAAEKAKEGVEVLLQIVSLAKSRLETPTPGGKGMPDPFTASQLEMFWRLIRVPEFQHLAAGMLVRLLAE
ncbi:MAG: hypothetical protein PWP58_1373 [Bacillota bacterium]|nr:hypothetical protein [Bacillota bacterium]MDK2883037.1 hypothetical protein [Bacillota bacterium]